MGYLLNSPMRQINRHLCFAILAILLSITITVYAQDTPEILRHCEPTSDNNLPNDLQGELIYSPSRSVPPSSRKLHFFDFLTMVDEELDITQGVVPIISPDGNWFATLAEKPQSEIQMYLNISSLKKSNTFELLLDGRVYRWLPGNILFGGTFDYPMTLFTYDPFTQELVKLRSIEVDGRFIASIKLWQWLEVDPTGNHIAYLSDEPTQPYSLIIENLRSGEVIWESEEAASPPQLFHVASATWSPDGQQFAFVRYQSNEYQVLTWDTTTKETTQVVSWKELELPGIELLEWSPDGKRIAYWVSSKREDSTKLYVTEFETGSTYDFCLTRLIGTASMMLWSPDGKYLLLSQWGELYDATLLNVENGERWSLVSEFDWLIAWQD